MSLLLLLATSFGILALGKASVLRPFSTAGQNSTLAPLSFNSSGLFQISVFEDLHFGEGENLEWGPQQDLNTERVMRDILDMERQSLVVLNGDLITGENTYEANSSLYVDKIVAPLIQRRLPWTSTYGNHDSDYNCSRTRILARERQLGPSLAYTRSDVAGRDAGVSNYYLLVFPSSDPQGVRSAPALIMWFFDSRGGNYYRELQNGQRVSQPDWVDQSVVSWFEETRSQLNATYGGASIPSIAFVHIPTQASLALQTNGTGQDVNTEPGINEDNPLAQQAQGWNPDGSPNSPGGGSVYGGQDVPFMKALVGTERLLAVFSGHDHGDDWCWRWQGNITGLPVTGNGLDLCFSRHSGYGGYSNWERGARQILLSEEMLKEDIIETWVRLESGNVSGSVVLNSTYGQDKYPAVPPLQTFCSTCDYS